MVLQISTVSKKKSRNELPHDKTNKMACAPREDSDQVFAGRTGHLVGFVMRRLKCCTRTLDYSIEINI